jgi:tripartite-type tricarboxylate transporter receptor subunit TctC
MLATAVTLLLLAAASPVRAQYPEQPIKAVVPFAAGGYVDGVARTFTDRLAKMLGRPIVVDNRAGAGGKLAEDMVSGAAPDGYTLLVSGVTRPTLMQMTADAARERDNLQIFDVIGVLAATPLVLTAANSLAVKDFQSLIARIRNEPDKHSYGSPGPGTPAHIVAAEIVRLFDLKIVHVPYRGGAPAHTDLVSGVIAWLMDTPGGARALIEARKITPIVVNNATRLRQLPNVPTMDELGYPQFTNQVSTIFLLAPKGTPRPVLERLNAAVIEAQKDPGVIARLDSLSLVAPPPDTTLERARAIAAAQIKAWDAAIKLVAP